jgi:hypothetical protein
MAFLHTDFDETLEAMRPVDGTTRLTWLVIDEGDLEAIAADLSAKGFRVEIDRAAGTVSGFHSELNYEPSLWWGKLQYTDRALWIGAERPADARALAHTA